MNLTEAKYLNDSEYQQMANLIERHKDKTKATKTEYRNSLMLRLYFTISSRSIEVLTLTPRHLGDTKITVPGAKGSNDRTFWIPKPLMRELNEYIEENAIGIDECIFKITTRHFRRIWKDYCPNHKKSSKAARHTGGLKLYKKSKDVRAVQYYLGHKNIKNSIIYMQYIEQNESLKRNLSGMHKQKLG